MANSQETMGVTGTWPETTLTRHGMRLTMWKLCVLAKQQPARAKHINRPNVILILIETWDTVRLVVDTCKQLLSHSPSPHLCILYMKVEWNLWVSKKEEENSITVGPKLLTVFLYWYSSCSTEQDDLLEAWGTLVTLMSDQDTSWHFSFCFFFALVLAWLSLTKKNLS